MRALTALLTTFLLAGCAGLMMGGAGAGAYEAGKDQRPAGAVASDSAITTRIKKSYVADPVVSVFNIGVRTWEGTVTLSGTVGSYIARDQAESIAKSTSGVKAVNNHIVIADKSAK